METDFQYEIVNQVARITLDRPHVMNALTLRIYRQLVDLFENLARVDDLIVRQDAELDPEKRRVMVQTLERIYAEERLLDTYVGVMNSAWGYRPEVSGARHFPLGTYTQQRLWDRYWLKG